MQKPSPEPQADLPPFQAVNAEELARNLLRLFEQGGNVLTEFIERNDAKMGPYSAATEITEATTTLSDLTRQWLADPARFAEANGTLLRSYGELWTNTVRRMFGETVAPVAEPEPGDSRFKDPEWSANPYFDFWKQAYLVTSRWAEDMLRQHRGPRRAHAPARRVLPAAGGERTFAVELPAHQSGGAARDASDQRGEPRAGHVVARRGHAQVRRSPQGQPDRHDRLRGRPQPGDDARQGCLPERHLPADPVRADHRQGARNAAAHRAAVDQQVLHPRSHAGEEPDQIPRRPGPHGLHRLVGEPRRASLAQVLRGLHAGGHPHRGRCREARDRHR